MSNPFAGIITTEFKTLFNNAIDALLESTALTRPCKLFYGNTKFSNCPNCKPGPNNTSSNRYNGTGPVSFPTGSICPVCVGKYKIPLEEDETLYLAVIWDFNKFIKPAGFSIDSADNYIQTICNISYYTQLKKATALIPNTNIEGLINGRYVKCTDVQPVGLGNDNFIFCTWKKEN
jgi:hypothetical protein